MRKLKMVFATILLSFIAMLAILPTGASAHTVVASHAGQVQQPQGNWDGDVQGPSLYRGTSVGTVEFVSTMENDLMTRAIVVVPNVARGDYVVTATASGQIRDADTFTLTCYIAVNGSPIVTSQSTVSQYVPDSDEIFPIAVTAGVNVPNDNATLALVCTYANDSSDYELDVLAGASLIAVGGTLRN